MNKYLRGGLIALTTVVTVVLVIVFFQNRAESKAQEAEMLRMVRMDNCQDDAYDYYVTEWNKDCKLERLLDGCTLPTWRATTLNDMYNSQYQQCIDMYSN